MSRHRWKPAEGQLRTSRCTNEGCTAHKKEKPHPLRGSKLTDYWWKDDAGRDRTGDKPPKCPAPGSE